MNIKAITSDEEFDSFKREWIKFENKTENQNFNTSFHFQRTWWKHFGHIDNDQYGYNKKLCILFLYDDGNNLKAIAPFCEVKRKIKKYFFYTIIEFIGQQFGGCYIDFVSNNLSKQEIDFIFDWLKKNRKYDLIKLQYIPEFTKNFDLNSDNIAILSACPEIYGESYLDTRKEYYSKNLKHKLNRIRNKMHKERKYINVMIKKGKDVFEYFNDIMEVSRSKKYSGKHSHYDEIEKQKYTKEIMTKFYLNLKCVFLLYKNKICAYNWGLCYNNKYYAMDAAYSREIRELENYSLGNIAYDEVLKDTLSSEIKHFCFGTGIDPYKFRFTKNIVKIYTFFKYGNTLKGIYLYKRNLPLIKRRENIFLKRLRKNLPNYDFCI